MWDGVWDAEGRRDRGAGGCGQEKVWLTVRGGARPSPTPVRFHAHQQLDLDGV